MSEIRRYFIRNGTDAELYFDPDGDLMYYSDHAAEVERLKAEQSKYHQAFGLLTTLSTQMEIDVEHPIEMAQKIMADVQAEVKRLKADLSTNAALLAKKCDQHMEAITEVERLNGYILELRGALGYEVPADTPHNRVVNGIAEALHQHIERLNTEHDKTWADREDYRTRLSRMNALYEQQKSDIAALTQALDEATMHVGYTRFVKSVEEEFVPVKSSAKKYRCFKDLSPASRALCERLFKEEK